MALDSGKKEVKLKTIDSHVPHVPAKSNLSIIYDNFKPTINRLQNEADATAAANYWQTFQLETTDQLYKISKEFENNPDGIKGAIDTYINNLLEKVPPKYKLQAASMLMASRSHLVTNASNNRYKLDESKLMFDNAQIWKSNNTNAENSIRVASEMPNSNLAKSAINDKTIEALLTVNEQSRHDYELMVKKGSKETRSDATHEKMINDELLALHISNGFHMMNAIGDEKLALEWLKLLSLNKNATPLINSELVKFGKYKNIENNPILIKYNEFLNDDDSREQVIDGILKRYSDFKKDRFTKKASDKSLNVDALKEPNNILSWENFNGEQSGNEIAIEVGALPGSTKYNQIIEDVNYKNYIAAKVNTFYQGGKLIEFSSEQEKDDVASKILADYGIHTIQMGLDQNGEFTDSFKTASHLLKELNIFPNEFKNYLQIEAGGSYDKPEVLAQLKEKILAYNFLTSDNMFPNWNGADPFLKWAAEQGLESRNDVVAAEIANSYKDIDWESRAEKIAQSFHEGNEGNFLWMSWNRLDNQISKEAHSPNAFLKLFMDEKNPLHKHILSQSDQTTWLPWKADASKIMPPNAKLTFEAMYLNELTLMAKSDNMDVWSKENKPLRKKAWHRTVQRLKDENWGIETNTSDGIPKLVKNPYWLTKGSFNNDDVYAHLNKTFHSKNKDELIAMFGTDNWEEVVKTYFVEYADNPNGPVKIALDNDGTNNYRLTIHKGADAITLDGYFEPHRWTNVIDENAPNSATQVVNHAADLMFKEFQKTDLYKNLDKEKSLEAEKFIYGTMRMGVQLGDWRWYPDIPGLNDTPIELRPFYYIANALGFEGDLRELRTTFETMNAIASESKSFVRKINENRNITNTEKAVEALYPPDKMPYSKNNMELNFQTWVQENYQDGSLALTHRTNNWGAVSSANWDGEMDVKYQRDSRKFAVFGHPKNSIRAAVKTILNHSTLTSKINDIDTRYGDMPTIEEILTMYAEDTTSYLKALKQYSNFEPNDRIDLLDSNQMHKLLKFIVRHEMGHEYYKEKFGSSNAYVDAVIFEGYNNAIQSYNGELGKYR